MKLHLSLLFSLHILVAGKSEELLESSESYHHAETTGQKIPVDPQSASGNPIKAAVPPPSQWDCKKKAEPCGDASEFPHGLPADLEEQRKFLTEQCIASFCLCLSRFPQHYKSLYRLAYLYTYSKTHKVSSYHSTTAVFIARLKKLNCHCTNSEVSVLRYSRWVVSLFGVNTSCDTDFLGILGLCRKEDKIIYCLAWLNGIRDPAAHKPVILD